MIHTAMENVLDDRNVLREQMRLLAAVPRRDVLVVLVLGLLMSMGGCINLDWSIDDVEVRAPSILHRMYFVVLVAAGLWATAIWHDEGPRRRAYRWSLPVERGRHDLLRVAAGGAWLLAALLAVLLIAALVALIVRPPSIDAWVWLNFVTGPVTVYLLGSIAGVRLDAPGRWVGALAGAAVWFWAMWIGGRIAMGADVYDAFFVGPLGLERALGQPFLMDGVAAMSEMAGETSMALTWIPAAALWLAIGGAGVFLASRQHKET
jgi:hypothetical protein